MLIKSQFAELSIFLVRFDDCKVKPIYALSPQAQGKIERPYRWLQDRIVRTCAREGIKTIQEAEKVLEKEVTRYNYHRVHSKDELTDVYQVKNSDLILVHF